MRNFLAPASAWLCGFAGARESASAEVSHRFLLLPHDTGGNSRALEVDGEGKSMREAPLPGYGDDIDRLKNGNVVVPAGDRRTPVEIDRDGKAVATPGGKGAPPKLGLHGFASAEELGNGNFMVTDWPGDKKGPVHNPLTPE